MNTGVNLGSGLAAGLSLSSHCSLELKGQLGIFDLHPLHLDAPGVCSIVQSDLKRTERDKCSTCFLSFQSLYRNISFCQTETGNMSVSTATI